MNARDDQPSTGDDRNRTAAFAADSALTAKRSATGFGGANAPQLAEQRQEPAEAADAAKRLRDLGKQALLDARPNDGQLGEFTLVREIGRGGMGVVYEAIQQSLHRRVALKVLPLGSLMNRHQIHRFQNESRAAAQLHHPNIVPVFSVGSDAGIHYYAMQFIEGNNLARVIAEIRRDVAQSSVHAGRGVSPAGTTETATDQPTQDEPKKPRKKQRPIESESSGSKRSGLSADDYIRARSSRRTPQVSAFFQAVARIGIQAAEALGHAHELSIVHRDVKPSNLMLDPSGKLWVTDFGLAQIRNAASMTKTGDLVGTLRYMSPEQASGRRAFLDHRTDIYSLGATLYELLTLRPVVPGKEFEEIFRQISFGRPVPLRRVNPRIPEELETIIGKTLERDPSDRYQTAAELAEDLRRFAADEPILARPPTLLKRYRRWMLRHRALSAGVAAALAVILVVSLGATAVALNALQLEKKQHQRAEAALKESEGSRLLTQAALMQSRDPGSALALAVQGAQLHPGPEANTALIAAMDANHELVTVTPRKEISASLAISPDGQQVITCVSPRATGNRPAIVHDVHTGRRVAELDNGSAIASAAFDPTGLTVLTASPARGNDRNGSAEAKRLSDPPVLWDTQTWRPRLTFRQASLAEAHDGVFSADGTRLVLCGNDATAIVYDVSSGQPLVTLRGHKGQVVFAGFSPDGRWISTASEDGTVAVHSAEGGEPRWTFPIRQGSARDATIAFTSDGGHLLISDASGTRFLPLANSDDAPSVGRFFAERTISVGRDARYAVVSSGRHLSIVDTQSLEVAGQIHLDTFATHLQLRGDGKRLLIGCRENLYLYDIPSGTLLATLAGHTRHVLDGDFTPTGDLIASVAADRTLRVWHSLSGYERRRYPGKLSTATDVLLAFSNDGRLVANASAEEQFANSSNPDGKVMAGRWPGWIYRNDRQSQNFVTCDDSTIYVWDAATSRRLAMRDLSGPGIRTAMAVPHSTWVGYTTDEGSAAIWNFATGQLVHLGSSTAVALDMDASPDGRRFAVGLADGRCLVADLADGRIIRDLPHDYRVVDICFSNDGSQLLTVDESNTVRIWEEEQQEENVPSTAIPVPAAPFGNGLFAGDDQYVVTFSAAGNKVVQCWVAGTGQLRAELAAEGRVKVTVHPTEPVVSIISDTGLQLWNLENNESYTLTEYPIVAARFVDDAVAAVSSVPQMRLGRIPSSPQPEEAGKLQLWEIASGQLLGESALSHAPVALNRVDPNQHLIVGMRSYHAQIYDLQTHELVMQVGDHSAAVVLVGFGKDDSQVVTASADGTVKIHDPHGRLLSTLSADHQPITAAAISHDGQLLATGDEDGQLVLWDLKSAAEVRRLSGHDKAIQSLAFDTSGHRLLSTSLDASVRLWDLRTGRAETFPVENGVFTADLSPDGKMLLIVPGEDAVRWQDEQRSRPVVRGFEKSPSAADAILIDLPTQQKTVVDQEGVTTIGRFSPDGRRFGLLARDGQTAYVDVRDVTSGQTICRIHSPSERVASFAFSSDSRRVATRQLDGLSVWEAETGELQLDIVTQLMRNFIPLAPWRARDWDPFSRDGKWLITLDDDDRMAKWPLDPLKEAKRSLPRPLTQQQSRAQRTHDAELPRT